MESFNNEKKGDEKKIATYARKKYFDAVVVYGGDGTQGNVIEVLYKTSLPLFPLPGGTANIFAKSVDIPQDTKTALDLIAQNKLKLTKIDIATINSKGKLLLAITSGLAARIGKGTKQTQKNKYGYLAYVFHSFHAIKQSKILPYTITIDGKTKNIQASSLIITNTGKHTVLGVSLTEKLQNNDGKIEILAIHKANPISLIMLWFAKMFQRRINYSCFRGKEIIVDMPKEDFVVVDDIVVNPPFHFEIKVDQKSLPVLINKHRAL